MQTRETKTIQNRSKTIKKVNKLVPSVANCQCFTERRDDRSNQNITDLQGGKTYLCASRAFLSVILRLELRRTTRIPTRIAYSGALFVIPLG